MLDIKFIRENPEKVREGAKNKNFPVDIDGVLKADEEYRKLLQEVQKLYAERNRVSKERDIEGGREIKAELANKEGRLKELKDKLDSLLSSVPNIPKDDVKAGIDESENEILRKYKEPTNFNFKVRDHAELGEILDVIDIERASKVSGTRFGYLKNEGALLEFALIQFAFDTLAREGFHPVIPPTLIKIDVMKKLGYMERRGDEDIFQIPKDGFALVGTAEQSIVPMHINETFLKKDLPLRYVGFSSSYRREAGSYGKDTRGILRVHQFDKAEMVSYVSKTDDEKELDYLLSLEEKLFQALEIPHEVLKLCTGDLGFPHAKKYDIYAWIPSQNKYREVTSTSTTTDFQARRLNIRYQDGADKQFVHILNGTAFAIGRTLIAILENYQQEDGTVIIPEALRKYTNFAKISPKNK